MCCPKCESDYQETWLVEDETTIHTDSYGNDWLYIKKGCQCKECNAIWYEHYSGLAKDFYWTDN